MSLNPTNAKQTIKTLWHDAGMSEDSLNLLTLTGVDPVMPSSFAIGDAAQSSIAAAALAASVIGQQRGGPLRPVSVDMKEAALECTGFFSLDGETPQVWDPIAGLYACGPEGQDGWVRLHTNFAHHRDGVLKLLGLPTGPGTPREAVAQALETWSAHKFEHAAAEAGLVVAAARSFEDWDAHPHARFVRAQPLVRIEKIADADPLKWPDLPRDEPTHRSRPLDGLRVLDLTRILAGPVCGRTLAYYGADVMLVNSPNLPNIASIADTSRGKRSTHIDLHVPQGIAALHHLLQDAHVFVQGYRPGALARLGFDPLTVAQHRPGIVYVSLSAYGEEGPWAARRGFDSLVQTATGFNQAEAQGASETQPRAMPVQILDYASGFLMAFGAQVALSRQALEGGSWHVRVSLARTGLWLRSLGRISNGLAATKPKIEGYTETSDSGFGKLIAMRHAAHFAGRPIGSVGLRASMPPGSHPPQW
jgi:CoA-transferase family III